MDKIGVKFTNKKPLRGIEKRPIMPSETSKEINVAYTQATKICKASGDTAVKNKAGEYVVIGTDMAGNLASTVENIKKEEEGGGEEPTDPLLPRYISDKNMFIANGNPITIKLDENGTDTVATWSETGSFTLTQGIMIIGGGYSENKESSKITVESGIVDGIIYLGGYNGNVATATGIVNGGKIRSLYGGGALTSEVTTATLTINNGEIRELNGAGAAFVTDHGQVGDENDAKNSPNKVTTANVTINGGKIWDMSGNNAKAGIFGASGSGVAYTGTCNLVVGGTADLSYDNLLLTVGASNGYVGTANLTLKNGIHVKTIQSGNRGKIETVNMTIEDAVVDALYVGGEALDDVTVSYVGETNPVITVNITAGTITSLNPGKDAGVVIPADSEKIKVTCEAGVTITNLDAAKTTFGTSLVIKE